LSAQLIFTYCKNISKHSGYTVNAMLILTPISGGKNAFCDAYVMTYGVLRSSHKQGWQYSSEFVYNVFRKKIVPFQRNVSQSNFWSVLSYLTYVPYVWL